MVDFQIHLVLELHIYLSGEKTSYILHTRKNLSLFECTTCFCIFYEDANLDIIKISTSKTPIQPKISYSSVPVTITELRISFIILVQTHKIELSYKNNDDLHILQTLHSTEECLLKYDVSFRRILVRGQTLIYHVLA